MILEMIPSVIYYFISAASTGMRFIAVASSLCLENAAGLRRHSTSHHYSARCLWPAHASAANDSDESELIDTRRYLPFVARLPFRRNASIAPPSYFSTPCILVSFDFSFSITYFFDA